MEGNTLGEALVLEASRQRESIQGRGRGRKRRVADAAALAFCSSNPEMQAVCQRETWFQPFLSMILQNHLKIPRAVNTNLEELTEAQALTIAAALAASLVSNTVPESGVDEWIGSYPALVEFDQQYAWFRPMMVTLARAVLKQSKIGLYYRAILGAGLSTMDMISDMYIISVFFAEGQYSYAYANIAMIMANWLIQLLIVWAQTGRNTLGSAFLKEALITTVGLKPGLDAWNVCSGKEQQPGQTLDPMNEVRIGRVKGVGG